MLHYLDMQDVLLTILLIGLFYGIGKSADWAVGHVRALAEALGIKVYFLGFILGAFTSIPELMVGINAVIQDVPAVSVGNLFGGIIVAFGLILAGSLILNRRVETDGLMSNFIPIALLLCLPVALGLDGRLSFIDGIIMMLCYLGVIVFLYQRNKHLELPTITIFSKRGTVQHIFYVTIGILLVLVFSDLIIRTTLILLKDINISPIIVGMLVYSIGTNLPEIVVTFRSWRKHIKELSVGHLAGSAMVNVFILGLISFLRPITLSRDASFYAFAAILVALVAMVTIFYRTNKSLSRREGFAMLAMYLLFVITQITLQVAE